MIPARPLRLLLSFLTVQDRFRLTILFACILTAGIIEAAGIASIAPFMAVISSGSGGGTIGLLLTKLKTLLQPDSQSEFVLYVGGAVLILLTLGNAFSALTMFLTTRFLYLQKHSLSYRLFSHYLNQQYPFFFQRNGADLLKNVFMTIDHAVAGVMMPLVNATSRVIIAACIIVLLIVVNPLLAVTVGGTLGLAYVMVFAAVKRTLSRAGTVTASTDSQHHITQRAVNPRANPLHYNYRF